MANILSERGPGILNQLREGMLLLDTDFRILAANQSFLSAFETEADEIQGIWLSSIASGPEDQLLLSSPTGGENIRVKIKTPTGKIIRTEMSFSPLLGQESELDGYAVLVRNISDQALREDKTRMMLEKYRDIALASADWLWEIDSSGTYTYVSQSVERFLGYTPDDFFGRRPFDFMPKDEAARATAIFSRMLLAGATLYNFQTRILSSSGEERILLTSGVPCYDSMGNLKGYRGSDKDITDTIRTAEELKKSLAQTRLILEKLPVGVVLIDRNKRIRQINSTAEKITGMSWEEVVGNVCHKIMCPAMEGQCPIIDLNQDIDNDEREVLYRDGRKIPVVKTVIPVRMDSEDLLLEVFTDVSEIKGVKSELKERNAELQLALEKLNETNRDSLKSDRLKASLHKRFLSEIVASLSSISGHSELISPAGSEEEIQEYLLRLEIDVDNLSRTLNLLKDKQVDCWKEALVQNQVMNPSKFRERLMNNFRKPASSRDITLSCEINDTLPQYLTCPVMGVWIILSEILEMVLDLPSLESILIGISSGAPSESGVLCFSLTGSLEAMPEINKSHVERLETDILKFGSRVMDLGGRLQFTASGGSGFVGMLFMPFKTLKPDSVNAPHSTNAYVISEKSEQADIYLKILDKAGCSHTELFDPVSESYSTVIPAEADSILLVIDDDLTDISYNMVQDLKIWIAKSVINWQGKVFTAVLSSGAVSKDSIRGSGLEYQVLFSKPVKSETFRKCLQLLHSLPVDKSALITDFSI